MPVSAQRPCGHPGCNKLVRGGNRCEQHRVAEKINLDRARGNSAQRGYDRRWRLARERFLQDHPFCNEHLQNGKHVMATVVDHKVPHRLYDARQSKDRLSIARAEKLFWDRSNWQSLCKGCHDKKTWKEDGAFGRGG